MFRTYADEGMWLPMLLGQQVYNDMVKKGLKLKPEQLYSVNNASLKDAIVIFGGGCTGEIVSNQGLIFTNHHCGYGAIAKASSVENNYLRDGFWAADKSKEIPTSLSVQFLNRIEDVTKNNAAIDVEKHPAFNKSLTLDGLFWFSMLMAILHLGIFGSRMLRKEQ